MGSRGHYSEEMDLIHYHLTNTTSLTGLVCSQWSELLALAPSSQLELDDLLLLHFGIIKIPITTVKVTLQKVKVKMMKKFQGY